MGASETYWNLIADTPPALEIDSELKIAIALCQSRLKTEIFNMYVSLAGYLPGLIVRNLVHKPDTSLCVHFKEVRNESC